MIQPLVGAFDSRERMARASAARQAGNDDEAIAILGALLAQSPRHAPASNLLGVIWLGRGALTEAARCFEQAIAAEPDPPFLWANLAIAQRGLGDRNRELASLEQALSRDPYFLPALLAKGETLRALGREGEAMELLRKLLDGLGKGQEFDEPIATRIHQAREWLRCRGEILNRDYAAAIAKVSAAWPSADLTRATAYAAQRAGLRKVYLQQPEAGFFPYLPAIEYFDRAQFPWFPVLERETDAIRAELLSLWADDDPSFRPYVAYPPGTPTNQWAELNHSPRWSAWFFWENGARNDAHCARCPATTAVIERLPLLDTPGKGPTVMFSVLDPHTRIPPHTGSTNARTTVHLPLVVPSGCGFRVGAETREWREGTAWAFDDTIEHEAWNHSDRPRAILIVDTWNPLLSDAEKAVVRAVG